MFAHSDAIFHPLDMLTLFVSALCVLQSDRIVRMFRNGVDDDFDPFIKQISPRNECCALEFIRKSLLNSGNGEVTREMFVHSNYMYTYMLLLILLYLFPYSKQSH